MEGAKVGKTSQIWLTGFDALMKWFFRRIPIDMFEQRRRWNIVCTESTRKAEPPFLTANDETLKCRFMARCFVLNPP